MTSALPSSNSKVLITHVHQPSELPRERSFRRKVQKGFQSIFSVSYTHYHINAATQSPALPLQIRPSHSRATSRGPSERGKSQVSSLHLFDQYITEVVFTAGISPGFRLYCKSRRWR